MAIFSHGVNMNTSKTKQLTGNIDYCLCFIQVVLSGYKATMTVYVELMLVVAVIELGGHTSGHLYLGEL